MKSIDSARTDAHNTTTRWLLGLSLVISLAGPAAAQDQDVETDAEVNAEASVSASLSTDGDGEAAADGEGTAPGRYEVGLRLSYGRAFGEYSKDVDIKDAVSSQVSIQLDLGYRVMPNLVVGAYLAGGPAMVSGLVKDNCDGDRRFSCRAMQMSAGVQAQYRLRPGTWIDPWVGAGVGVERLVITRDWDASGSAWTSYLALPQLLAQFGIDFSEEPDLVFGPFLSWSMASYGSESTDCRGSICNAESSSNQDVENARFHHFINFGLRGTLVL